MHLSLAVPRVSVLFAAFGDCWGKKENRHALVKQLQSL